MLLTALVDKFIIDRQKELCFWCWVFRYKAYNCPLQAKGVPWKPKPTNFAHINIDPQIENILASNFGQSLAANSNN